MDQLLDYGGSSSEDEVVVENHDRSLQHEDKNDTAVVDLSTLLPNDCSQRIIETEINSAAKSPTQSAVEDEDADDFSGPKTDSLKQGSDRVLVPTVLTFDTTGDEVEAFMQAHFDVSAQGLNIDDLAQGFSDSKLWLRTTDMLQITDSKKLPLLEMKLGVLVKIEPKKRKAKFVQGPGKKAMTNPGSTGIPPWCSSFSSCRSATPNSTKIQENWLSKAAASARGSKPTSLVVPSSKVPVTIKLPPQMTGSNAHWVSYMENMMNIRASLGCEGDSDFKNSEHQLVFYITPEKIKSLQEKGIDLSGGQSPFAQFLKLCKQVVTGAGMIAREQRQRRGDPSSFQDVAELDRVVLMEQQKAAESFNKRISDLNAEMRACDQALLNPEETDANLMIVVQRKRTISLEITSIRSDQIAVEEEIAGKFQAARHVLLERKSSAIASAAALVSDSKSRVPPSTNLMSALSRAQAITNSVSSGSSSGSSSGASSGSGSTSGSSSGSISSSSSSSSSSILSCPNTPVLAERQPEVPVAPSRPGARLMSLLQNPKN
jgi:hypothetical protein